MYAGTNIDIGRIVEDSMMYMACIYTYTVGSLGMLLNMPWFQGYLLSSKTPEFTNLF